MKRAIQCRHIWERKPRGLRYATARGQCKRETAHPSGYCSEHRFDYRWSAREVAEDIIVGVPAAGSEQPIFCGPGCAQFHDQPCSEQPDLPLGHEFWNPGFPNMDGSRTVYPSACKLCGQSESAHRRKGK